MKISPFPLLAPLFLLSLPAFSAEKETPNALPLRDVALFSSGVGYFGRAGQIDGDARVELRVKAPQISDILKSLVLFDPKGTIKPVSYSLADWVGTRPLDTDLAVANSSSPGTLLRGFQGASVHIERPTGVIEGRILSVSERQIMVGDKLVSVEHLSLLTSKGIQTVRLDDVSSFKLLDPELDAKLMATLEKRAIALTKKLDDGARAVALNFGGKGKREVRAGYLLETPAWKTSYRLVLGPKSKPYLQGWAIVENTTDEDWKGVNLSLVSGRPISFFQDLATPVYIARPIVAPMIIGSPRPQTFGEGFAPTDDSSSRVTSRVDALETRNGMLENRLAPPPRLSITPSIVHQSGTQNHLDQDTAARAFLNPSTMQAEGAKSQAQGEERGELFEYAIDGATTLARGEAAMVPIVSTDIGGEALTIVESGLQKGTILSSNGFYLRNTSGLHLQGGPITVFSDGIYGGDALVANLSPNDSRLITYAVDLELAALQEEPLNADSIVKISLSDGVLTVKRSLEKTRSWNFKNKSETAKNILLQVPDEDGWKLADPKQLEGKAAGVQRFRIAANPGETKYSVKWVQTTQDIVIVANENADSIAFYLNEKAASPAMKAKLAEFVAGKRKLAELERQRAAQEASIKDISEDQARIRANMEPLERNSKLFKSYEIKLGAQEEKIERARAEIERLREVEAATRQQLRKALSDLDLE